MSARRIGAHLPLGGGMVRAVERALEIGATTLQVFSDNPLSWRRRSAPPPELPAFRDRLAAAGIAPLAIHASYLVNLAGPDETFRERSIAVLAHELRTAALYGAAYVNVHVGSHRGAGEAAGMARLGSGIARVLAEAAGGSGAPGAGAGDRPAASGTPPLLVLENSAGGGDGMGATVEELTRIRGAAVDEGAEAGRIAFCFDTAHLWGAGHDLADPAALDHLLEAFDRAIGLDRLVMAHLNDSKAPLGSHLDRHEHIGAGQIGAAGLGGFLRHPSLEHLAFYIETPGMDEGWDAVNLARARQLSDGLPLDELPAEALLVRGSRSRRAPAKSAPRSPG